MEKNCDGQFHTDIDCTAKANICIADVALSTKVVATQFGEMNKIEF